MNIVMGTRIVLVILAALLALPTAQSAPEVAAKGRARTVTRTFSNATPLALPTSLASPVSASLYPSEIAVGGLRRGRIRDVNVRLRDLTHTAPREVEVLLVGPDGQFAVLMAGVGGSDDVAGVTVRVNEEAAGPMPVAGEGALGSGTFTPTVFVNMAITFNAPAPGPTARSELSDFDSTNPNGTWHLFVQDDSGSVNPGAFAGGWELEITAKVKAKKRR